ncbi:MAG: phospholipase D-like domain-containing protein, partial [Bacteroidia bacterium]|nr:phospholipase D-like domain-containing protein [Bacteroidia bacterium]
MPKIYDNSKDKLLDALQGVLKGSQVHTLRIATGYFQLLAWHKLVGGLRLPANFHCDLLIGMLHRTEEEQVVDTLADGEDFSKLSLEKSKERVLEVLKRQLTEGLPTLEVERALKQLQKDLRAPKTLVVKAYLCPQALHAKLYLIERDDKITPQIGFLGSSNFTLAGLQTQGELNVDVTDQDATSKLQRWFDGYWNQPCAVDITEELARAIEESWAFQTGIHPYHLFLRIAYHLSEPVLSAQSIEIPSIFKEKKTELLPHQVEAIRQLLYLLNTRKGALLGDVVGLGKTLTAAVVARIFSEERGGKTLVLCPANLTSMWRHYLANYNIWGDVISLGEAPSKLKDYPTVSLVIIDESHNLRNPEGKRYEAVWKYLRRHTPMPKVLLLSATPYNKQFEDLSAQLKLFLDETEDLGVRPEAFIRAQQKAGKLLRDIQAMLEGAPLTSLRAFMQSHNPTDWRNLMRLFLVRRTRTYVQENYALKDDKGVYLEVGGKRYYFPKRLPRTISYQPEPVAQNLLQAEVVNLISALHLPRYGLANYLLKKYSPECLPTPEEEKILQNLKQARTQLRGFVKASLYKRLESSTYSFLLSVLRHILRNYFLLEAI